MTMVVGNLGFYAQEEESRCNEKLLYVFAIIPSFSLVASAFNGDCYMLMVYH